MCAQQQQQGGGSDVRDKTDHGNGQPEYGQQHINETLNGAGDGDPLTAGSSELSAAAAGLSATLGVGIKEYMNVPWMPLVQDVDSAEPTGNSLDPSADRREQSGRGFTSGGGGVRTGGGGRTSGGSNKTSANSRPVAESASQESGNDDDDNDDRFPYDDEPNADHGKAGGGVNGTAGEIREPVLRPKSRIRMYRMPDGSTAPAVNGTPTLPPSPWPLTMQTNGSSVPPPPPATAERSFIVHLLPHKLMNMIEQAERYARMAFSPFMWPTKERAQRALKNFPRSVII